MFQHRRLGILAAVSFALLGANNSANAAPVVVDNFQTTQSAVSNDGSVSSNGPLSTPDLTFNSAATRTLDIQRTAQQGPGAVSSINTNSTVSNALALSNDTGAASFANITYNFGSALNFTGVSTLSLLNFLYDVGPPDITVTLYNGATSASTNVTILPAANTTGDVNFDLTGLNAAVLANVTKLVISIDTSSGAEGAGTDLRFTDLALSTNPPLADIPPGVPEPATLLTFGALALFGGYSARRKLKAAAVAQA